MEKCYTVAETVKLTGVKSYVLRYWEEELEIPVGRTNLGHRCYTEDDIRLILNIKELKNRGLQLRAIKDLLPKICCKDIIYEKTAENKDMLMLEIEDAGKGEKTEEETQKSTKIKCEEEKEKIWKLERKSDSETKISPEERIEAEKKVESEEKVNQVNLADSAKILEFEEIMERLIAQELHAKKEGEDRWRSLDEAIRRQQLARKEAAVASEKKEKKSKKGHK